MVGLDAGVRAKPATLLAGTVFGLVNSFGGEENQKTLSRWRLQRRAVGFRGHIKFSNNWQKREMQNIKRPVSSHRNISAGTITKAGHDPHSKNHATVIETKGQRAPSKPAAQVNNSQRNVRQNQF